MGGSRIERNYHLAKPYPHEKEFLRNVYFHLFFKLS
jgi:hypothetical protein